MNPPQGDFVPMETTSQSNKETQMLIRLFHQTKTIPILSYEDLTNESVKPVFNTFTGYESNHESPPFSINDAKNVTSNLINVSTAVQNPKYHDNPNKSVIWLRRFMKAQNADSFKDSSIEGI